MLLPIVDGFDDDVPRSLSQHMLFPHTLDLHVHRDTRGVLCDLVIQERHPALDGMSHLAAITEEVEDEVVQHGLRPEIERLVEGIPIP